MAVRNAVAHGGEPQLDALEARGVRVDVDTVHGLQVVLDDLVHGNPGNECVLLEVLDIDDEPANL